MKNINKRDNHFLPRFICAVIAGTALGFCVLGLGAKSSHAAGAGEPPPHQHWHFSGPFGTYDKASMQRGFQVYREVCSACHAMKHLKFRNLSDLGYNENQIKNLASEYTVTDGPDDEGEMFERPALPKDSFPSPYPNDKAAAAANGSVPPDLSLMTKARAHGSDYVYALLTGYKDAPEDKKLGQGQYWNKYMPGHVISMAPPLSEDMVAYEDGSPQTVEQYSVDVVNFMTWAADPYMEQRKKTGLKVIFFLIVFAGVMYAVKRKVWADIH